MAYVSNYKLKLSQEEKAERIDKVVPYIKQIIGTRTAKQASIDMGIPETVMSKLLNGKYWPTVNVLMKIADKKSKPQNGVTLEDLMIAAGYSVGCVQVTARYENITKTIFLSEIMQNNIAAKPVEYATGILKGYKPSLILSVSGQPVSEWWLDFRLYDESCKADEITLCDFLGLLTSQPAEKNRKVSRVISNKRVFEQLSAYAGNLSYRGDLSIILVDIKEMCVLKEVYLSHYCEENKNSEFYII